MVYRGKCGFVLLLYVIFLCRRIEKLKIERNGNVKLNFIYSDIDDLNRFFSGIYILGYICILCVLVNCKI